MRKVSRNKKKIISKNEFRYNNKTKHPNYIFEEKGNRYHAIGITHSEYTFGRKNMKLKQNPKKFDTSIAYIRNGIINERKQNFSANPIKNMSFSSADFKLVKSKIRNYKNRRRK